MTGETNENERPATMELRVAINQLARMADRTQATEQLRLKALDLVDNVDLMEKALFFCAADLAYWRCKRAGKQVGASEIVKEMKTKAGVK